MKQYFSVHRVLQMETSRIYLSLNHHLHCYIPTQNEKNKLRCLKCSAQQRLLTLHVQSYRVGHL